jgi:hypothetical protein
VGFRDMNIWKHSFFKGFGSLFGSPKRIQKCVFISESGIVSMELLPLMTGLVYFDLNKVAWLVIQKLKMSMQGSDELVLPISERSHMPLDPLGRLSDDERKKLEPLKNIARAKHAEALSRVVDDNKKSANAKMMTTIVTCCFILTGIIVLIYMIKK